MDWSQQLEKRNDTDNMPATMVRRLKRSIFPARRALIHILWKFRCWLHIKHACRNKYIMTKLVNPNSIIY